MREVCVEGHIYSIPENEPYKVSTSEMLYMSKRIKIKEILFPPTPEDMVEIKTYVIPVDEPIEQEAIPKSELVQTRKVPLRSFLVSPQPTIPDLPKESRKGLDQKRIDFFSLYTDSFLSDLKGKGTKEEDLRHKPLAGQRVRFTVPNGRGAKSTGTVVGMAEELLSFMGKKEYAGTFHSQAVVVCSDIPDLAGSSTESCRLFEPFTGPGHSIVILQRDLREISLEEMSNPGSFEAVPKHIGILVTSSFGYDGVDFTVGQHGRIVEKHRDNMYTISWNHKNGHFWEHPTMGRTCFNVPAKHLQICRFDLGEKADSSKYIASIWPDLQGGESFKTGDLVEISGGRYSVYIRQSDTERILPQGAIGKIEKSMGRTYKVSICGGVDVILIGGTLDVRQDHLRKMQDPEKFFFKDQTVEIVAEIDFRKCLLRGKKAKVILPTDQEGDVGLEFDEDLQAGSLDGIGKGGHCLYVQASTIKVSE